MPATKHSPRKLSRALIVSLGLVGLSLSAGSVHAEPCAPSSVDFMHITGEEDLSAMGQIASLAGAATRSGHIWESTRTARVQLAARTARVGEYAPQSIDQAVSESTASPVRSDSASTKQPTIRPTISNLPADTSSSSAGVRSISKPQIKSIKVPVVKKLR